MEMELHCKLLELIENNFYNAADLVQKLPNYDAATILAMLRSLENQKIIKKTTTTKCNGRYFYEFIISTK